MKYLIAAIGRAAFMISLAFLMPFGIAIFSTDIITSPGHFLVMFMISLAMIIVVKGVAAWVIGFVIWLFT